MMIKSCTILDNSFFSFEKSVENKKNYDDNLQIDHKNECLYDAPIYLIPQAQNQKLIQTPLKNIPTKELSSSHTISSRPFRSGEIKYEAFDDFRSSTKFESEFKDHKYNDKWDLFKRDSPRSQKLARSLIQNFTNEENFSLSNSINFSKHSLDTGIKITNLVVQEVCSMNPKIKCIDLTDCSDVTDVGLWAISRHCTELEKANFSRCDGITNIGLRSLAIKCTNIKQLNFSKVNNLDDQCLRIIAANLKNLEILVLSFCNRVTDTGVGEVAKCCHKLSVLRLNNCAKIGEFGDRALLEIGKNCPLLTVLDLYGCNHVADAGLKAIANGCLLLNDLHLSECSKVTNSGIESLISGCHNLVHFTLTKCPNINCDDILCIVHRCPNLIKLDFSDCTSIGASGLKAIATNLVKLTNLNLSRCISVDDNALNMLAKSSENLRILKLAGCKALSPKGVKNFVKLCPWISTLDLTDCKNIRRHFLYDILTLLPYCNVSNSYFGFEPKENEDQLRLEALQLVTKTKAVITIQRVIRGFKARSGEIKEKRIAWTIKHLLPKAQAHFRRYIQCKSYRNIQHHLKENASATLIQQSWRSTVGRRVKNLFLKERLKFIRREKNIVIVQRLYRGYRGRVHAHKEKENENDKKFQDLIKRARQNSMASILQTNIRRKLAMIKLKKLIWEQTQTRKMEIKKIASAQTMQKVVRGLLARHLAKKLHIKKQLFISQWSHARSLQSAWRGMLGRRCAEKRYEERNRARQLNSIKHLQRIWRGYKGRILGKIAKSAKELRDREELAVVYIQCVYRGKLGRDITQTLKTARLLAEKRELAVRHFQRLFRGHKGREQFYVRKGMKEMEFKAKPLFEELESLQKKLKVTEKSKANYVDTCKKLSLDLSERRNELSIIGQTQSKFWDSDRITGTPQRFVTSLLKQRLKEQLKACQVDFKECKEKVNDWELKEKDILRQIRCLKREIDPLTVGVKQSIMKERPLKLRKEIRLQRKSSIQIQKLYRGYRLRATLNIKERNHRI